jgi:hypothetical protein
MGGGGVGTVGGPSHGGFDGTHFLFVVICK